MNNFNAYNPIQNPLLADVDQLSPAIELTLVVGQDAEGWAIYETFQAQAIVVISGKLWKIQGFTLDDLIVVSPYGLGHDDPEFNWMIVYPEGIQTTEPQHELRHPSSLIAR